MMDVSKNNNNPVAVRQFLQQRRRLTFLKDIETTDGCDFVWQQDAQEFLSALMDKILEEIDDLVNVVEDKERIIEQKILLHQLTIYQC
jgi:hypothetical protein